MAKISFFQANKITCPVCASSFSREVMRTGGGRVIAGDLQDDLRREYRKSTKYGIVNPLIYNAVVCPTCFYAALPEDFSRITGKPVETLKNETALRKKHVKRLFGDLDFTQERLLLTGAASFFLGITSYAHFPKGFAPSTKKALCAMRASWCLIDLHKAFPKDNYDKLYQHMRYLALKTYEKAFETTSTGSEDFSSVKHAGPDTDVNFGYEGVLYMTCYLGYELKNLVTAENRYKKFKEYRTILAKVFGFGKVSKAKPTPLLIKARYLHEKIHAELDTLKETHEAQ